MFKRVFPWQVGTVTAIFVLGSKKLQRKGGGGEDVATNGLPAVWSNRAYPILRHAASVVVPEGLGMLLDRASLQ